MEALSRFRTYVIWELFGLPAFIKLNYVINFFKAMTGFYIMILMAYYQNYSVVSYLYLGIHGSYGALWILKDIIFPDKQFQTKVNLLSGAMVIAILAGYWVIPYLTICDADLPLHTTNHRLLVAILLYVLGVFFMIGSDCQKYYTLKYLSPTTEKFLISDGFFKITRNPNYLGEMMLYLSFALLSQHWLSYLILFGTWLTLF